jgi:hypothetical protein
MSGERGGVERLDAASDRARTDAAATFRGTASTSDLSVASSIAGVVMRLASNASACSSTPAGTVSEAPVKSGLMFVLSTAPSASRRVRASAAPGAAKRRRPSR